MAVTNAFREAVASGNVRGVRIMMKDSLLVDPTFQEFGEMERLAETMKGLYEAYDGRALSEDQSTWNDAYMNRLMVELVGNFSHERIAHIKRVVQYLHPAPTRTQNAGSGEQQTRYRTRYQVEKERDLSSGDFIRNAPFFLGGAAVGGIGGALVVGTVGGTVGGALIGAAAGMGISAALDRGER